MWLLGVSLAVMWGLTLYAQMTVMTKQAAAPPSAPQAQILAMEETNAAAGGNATAPGANNQSGTSSGGGAAPSSPLAQAGQKVYSQNCSSCHGATGMGTPGAFPPLANNPFVTGNANDVITTVLNGKTGAITVNGASYNGQMPPWKATLSNKDIAAVVTYIRSGLGNNKASAVTEQQVAKLKK
jgi:mono/diheme cytochrome c family protein